MVILSGLEDVGGLAGRQTWRGCLTVDHDTSLYMVISILGGKKCLVDLQG